MRNLLKYPVTPEEVLAALETALERENDDDRVGDIAGMCIEATIRYLRDNPRATMCIVESMAVNE